MTLKQDENGVRISSERPKNYRWCGTPLEAREKSVLVDYYGHLLFLPKSVVFSVDEQIVAPDWAIQSAKDFNEARA